MKIQNVQRPTCRFQWIVHITLVQVRNSGSLKGWDKDREKSLTIYQMGQTDSASDLCVCRAVSVRYFTPLSVCSCCCAGFPLGGSVIPEAQPWAAAAPSWSQLALALSDTGEAAGTSSHCQNHATQTKAWAKKHPNHFHKRLPSKYNIEDAKFPFCHWFQVTTWAQNSRIIQKCIYAL